MREAQLARAAPRSATGRSGRGRSLAMKLIGLGRAPSRRPCRGRPRSRGPRRRRGSPCGRRGSPRWRPRRRRATSGSSSIAARLAGRGQSLRRRHRSRGATRLRTDRGRFRRWRTRDERSVGRRGADALPSVSVGRVNQRDGVPASTRVSARRASCARTPFEEVLLGHAELRRRSRASASRWR